MPPTLRPPTPSRTTWYAYLFARDLGLLKVAHVTYLNDRTEGDRQHTYVHVAHASPDGEHEEVDRWVPGGPSPVVVDGRRITVDLPGAAVGLELTGEHIDPDRARADVVVDLVGTEIRVVAEAPLDRFYDQITPSQTVFGAEHPVAKTMGARIDLSVGDDHVVFEHGIFELGGARYPAGAVLRRPVYRYA